MYSAPLILRKFCMVDFSSFINLPLSVSQLFGRYKITFEITMLACSLSAENVSKIFDCLLLSLLLTCDNFLGFQEKIIVSTWQCCFFEATPSWYDYNHQFLWVIALFLQVALSAIEYLLVVRLHFCMPYCNWLLLVGSFGFYADYMFLRALTALLCVLVFFQIFDWPCISSTCLAELRKSYYRF